MYCSWPQVTTLPRALFRALKTLGTPAHPGNQLLVLERCAVQRRQGLVPIGLRGERHEQHLLPLVLHKLRLTGKGKKCWGWDRTRDGEATTGKLGQLIIIVWLT